MKTTVDPLPRYGAGVALRRLSTSDLAAFQAYRTDTVLGRYQGWSPMQDAQALAFLNEMNKAPLFRPGNWVQVAITGTENLSLLGDIGIYLAEDSRNAEVGFTLARPAQGRGLATAAIREALQFIFQFTKVELVFGITDARNHASVGVLERAGMSKQEERNAVFRGEACVEYVYAVLRPVRYSYLLQIDHTL
jgi:aminoglycoside 6'-N-acetyltransferase